MVPLTALEGERKRRQEAKEEAAYWKGVAEAGGKAPGVPTPPEPVKPAGPPQPPTEPDDLDSTDFDDYSEYEKAQKRLNREYQAKRDEYVTAKVKYDLKQESHQQTEQQTQAQKHTEYLKRLEKAAELDPELQDIADNWHQPGQYQLPLNGIMQEAILESEVGPELLRHLYNNKQDTARIARLGAVAAMRELVKLESTLNKSTPVRQVSSAPPPITPVTTRGAIEVDDDKRPAADVIREMREASFRR
jgi:hypothetical protein